MGEHRLEISSGSCNSLCRCCAVNCAVLRYMVLMMQHHLWGMDFWILQHL